MPNDALKIHESITTELKTVTRDAQGNVIDEEVGEPTPDRPEDPPADPKPGGGEA